MPRYEFTARAVEDLREIGRYTKQAGGVVQARRYREELELALKKLSLRLASALNGRRSCRKYAPLTSPLILLSIFPGKMGLLFYGYYTLTWMSSAPSISILKNPMSRSGKFPRISLGE